MMTRFTTGFLRQRQGFLAAATAAAMLIAGAGFVLGEGEERNWRTWTSDDGAEIEAYLQEVLNGEIVIVRRDGREFRVALDRFSDADQAYVAERQEEDRPGPQQFAGTDFAAADLPDRHEIEDVGHVQAGSGEPLEFAAIRMIFDFHEVDYDPDRLGERLEMMAAAPEEPMSVRDVRTSLDDFNVETEAILPGDDDWQNAIRTALSWDLPVLIAQDPLLVRDQLQTSVAIGYDRRGADVLDPLGGRGTIPLDFRDLEETFLYAVVVFPDPDPDADDPESDAPETPAAPDREFLSGLSSTIRQAPELDPVSLNDHLDEEGINAEIRDVNRSDYETRMGQTRSFARTGGLRFVEDALEAGRLVILPQELNRAEVGALLIYGRDNDNFQSVLFHPDRTFERETRGVGEVAGQWLTREDRAYRLYLIEVTP